jgi:CBS domain-containing protein
MATTQSVADVMTTNPIVLDSDAPLAEAARAMRDADIGDVIVLDEGAICGIATDRDIVVRAIAAGMDPATTPIGEVFSRDLTTLAPESPVDDAVRLMREKAVRRLPVVEGDRPVGVVSLGDLAAQRDPRSALADISEAPPNA